MKETKSGQMLTAAKLAEQIGISAGKVRKAITELKIEPDLVKAGCNYYSLDCVDKIKKKLWANPQPKAL